MNFLKNTFLKFLPKQKPQQASNIQVTSMTQTIKTQTSQIQIPQQILEQMFIKSSQFITSTSRVLSDNEKLLIYGLYKQATVGDCNIDKPGLVDFIKRTKWNAWNQRKGMSKTMAMQIYIQKTVEIDPNIQTKMQNFFEGQIAQDKPQQKQYKKQIQQPQQGNLVTGGLKMISPRDYSSRYSHAYFARIQQNEPLCQIDKQTLLIVNNNPKCYALHFAIDKQRFDLVQRFLQLLTKDEILMMKDQDGTSIIEYAHLIENQQIIQMVNNKMQL